MQLLVTITDTFSGGLIDVIVANIAQTVDSIAEVETYMGNFGVVNFTFGITIHCTESFCGPDCESTCVPRNDSSGHFSCNDLQCMVCLPGFQNVTSNCTDCVPRLGCCKLHTASCNIIVAVSIALNFNC